MNSNLCHPCGLKNKVKGSYTRSSYLGAILLALLPKCPLCITAYSSAITLCGTSSINAQPEIPFIQLMLAGITLTLVLINFKGIKTLLAGILILFGSIFIFSPGYPWLGISSLHWGSILLLVGVWTNGSLFHFFRKLKFNFF